MTVSGNGTELTGDAGLRWRSEHRVEWRYTAPGKPMYNGFVDSFGGRMLDRSPIETMFSNLAHTRIVIAAWATDDNTERLPSALEYLTSADYARTLSTEIARPAPLDESSVRREIAQPVPSGETPDGPRSRFDEYSEAGHNPEPIALLGENLAVHALDGFRLVTDCRKSAR